MTITVNQWAREDQEVQALIKELQPLCLASRCVGLDALLLVQNPASITQRLDECEIDEDEIDWIKNMITDVASYINCGKTVLFFSKQAEADVFLIHLETDSSPLDVDNNNWIIISLKPMLIMSMYGAVLGISKGQKGLSLVNIVEGDPGWDCCSESST